jgi:hypothetical protein
MSAANFKVFGIPMQRQQTRRRLVVTTYVVLAAICVGTILVAPRSPYLYSYGIYAAVAVGLFLFGGFGQRGLLKGFENKPPRPESPQIEFVRLHLAPETILSTSDAAWRNDERELERRDRAHFRAYQPMSLGFMLLLLLSAVAMRPPHWMSATIVLQGIFAVAEIMTMLALTLPAAIILWTEPDMEFDETFEDIASSKAHSHD